MSSSSGPHSRHATYYRTALLPGLVRGEAVHAWAERVLQDDPRAPHAFVEIASTPPADLTALRHALWPPVIEPDPPQVVEAVLQGLHADLTSGRRGLTDTVTIMPQMRSMLRLPRDMYDSLTAAPVAHIPDKVDGTAIAAWLERFAGARPIVRS